MRLFGRRVKTIFEQGMPDHCAACGGYQMVIHTPASALAPVTLAFSSAEKQRHASTWAVRRGDRGNIETAMPLLRGLRTQRKYRATLRVFDDCCDRPTACLAWGPRTYAHRPVQSPSSNSSPSHCLRNATLPHCRVARQTGRI